MRVCILSCPLYLMFGVLECLRYWSIRTLFKELLLKAKIWEHISAIGICQSINFQCWTHHSSILPCNSFYFLHVRGDQGDESVMGNPFLGGSAHGPTPVRHLWCNSYGLLPMVPVMASSALCHPDHWNVALFRRSRVFGPITLNHEDFVFLG